MTKKERDARWRARRREHIREQQRAWYAKNREHMKEYRARPEVKVKDAAYHRTSPKVRLLHTKRGAKSRQLPFELSDEQAVALFQSPCYYCGAPATPLNGIDRVDNVLGYIVGNVVPACARCNSGKGKLSLNEFCAWIGAVHAHLNSKGT